MKKEHNGYIRLFRSFHESDDWTSEKFTRAQAWIDLIFLARYKESVMLVRGIEVIIPRGSLAWGEKKLSERWMWSRSKARRFLDGLKTRQQIGQQKNNIISIISIVNYNIYQITENGRRNENDTTERPQKDRRKTADRHMY